MDQRIIFNDRIAAGEQLAEKLLKYKSEKLLILALPRGGVPVAYMVAQRLKAPLDTLVVRKIGAPFNQEFGVGAIAPANVLILDNAIMQSLNLTRTALDPIIVEELEEMDRRIIHYHSGEYSKNVTADTVIIVDDGLATGVSARAAIESAKRVQKPKKIIFASPICARDSADFLRDIVNDVVCVGEVNGLTAIGYWYHVFDQTEDKEVIYYLDKANKYYEQFKKNNIQ